MHVLQLTPYPPPEGGITRNALAIREELRRNGYRCSIIATTKSDAITEEPDVYHPRTSSDLIKLLRRLEYDVLHVHIGGEISLRVLALLRVCAFFGRGKSVLTFHSGGYTLANAETAKKTSLTGSVFRKYEKIIGVNSLMLKMFANFGVKPERLHLIPPFVHRNPDGTVAIPENLRVFAEKHQPFLLTVSLLEDAYDLPLQIDALGKVLEKMPNAGLMIVGAGSIRGEIESAVAAKTYAERILLAGNVANPITLHLINRADILLRTTKYDGDAISIREALFLETPVIATDNQMRPDDVNLIPIHDENALAAAIETLAGRKREPKIAKPDDTRNIEAVLKVYEELLKDYRDDTAIAESR